MQTKVIKSDDIASSRKKCKGSTCRDPSNELFSPVSCSKGKAHNVYGGLVGKKDRSGKSNRNQYGRTLPLPLFAPTSTSISSLVHFLLSSILSRHYSSPRTISNTDRRRLPPVFLLFMVKFIGTSSLPWYSSSCEEKETMIWKNELRFNVTQCPFQRW